MLAVFAKSHSKVLVFSYSTRVSAVLGFLLTYLHMSTFYSRIINTVLIYCHIVCFVTTQMVIYTVDWEFEKKRLFLIILSLEMMLTPLPPKKGMK